MKEGTIRIIPLGGLGEIGKNITAIEYEDEIIVIDCGIAFPDEDMYGVDLIIPDITYLINNRKIQVDKHFEKKVNYCLLNEEGRKIFIEAFEGRLESVFKHPKLKRNISYRTAIKLDCYKLIKWILEDKEFIPFSIKEGM